MDTLYPTDIRVVPAEVVELHFAVYVARYEVGLDAKLFGGLLCREVREDFALADFANRLFAASEEFLVENFPFALGLFAADVGVVPTVVVIARNCRARFDIFLQLFEGVEPQEVALVEGHYVVFHASR